MEVLSIVIVVGACVGLLAVLICVAPLLGTLGRSMASTVRVAPTAV